jgi:hypothetical protein
MAERVEVIRVGEGAKMREVGKKWSERHSIGSYKAVEINSWLVGIETRESKLGRIENAADFNRAFSAKFRQWCIDNGLTPNEGVGGFIKKIVREYVRNGPKHAEILLSVVPAAYRRFWDENKEILISMYKNVRS